ncbi:MAG: hypothetical protein LBG61_03095 [Burkholderiales bacterium]|jgi:antitoxin component YwqK of YwqJK toxin-antitoxin module|nr:hypothetical protein [Burkholderiales bacterium]
MKCVKLLTFALIVFFSTCATAVEYEEFDSILGYLSSPLEGEKSIRINDRTGECLDASGKKVLKQPLVVREYSTGSKNKKAGYVTSETFCENGKLNGIARTYLIIKGERVVNTEVPYKDGYVTGSKKYYRYWKSGKVEVTEVEFKDGRRVR